MMKTNTQFVIQRRMFPGLNTPMIMGLAKRLECVRLAAAFETPRGCQSGGKPRALQTLREGDSHSARRKRRIGEWFCAAAATLTCIALVGCATSAHSISNSGYHKEETGCWGYPYHPITDSDPDFAYRGELSEFDVLGISRGQLASESDIAQALDAAKAVKLRSGSSVLLIQSGAVFPDAPMVAELSKHFRVVPFSGVPNSMPSTSGWHLRDEAQSYSKSLRLAAARGGNDFILCYWGMLESEKENLETKTVSWVPGVNWLLPDEKQHKRIRLKLALVDVRSGNWSVFSPSAFEASQINRSPRRAVADQKLVESLKQKAYESGVQEFVRLYAQN